MDRKLIGTLLLVAAGGLCVAAAIFAGLFCFGTGEPRLLREALGCLARGGLLLAVWLVLLKGKNNNEQ